MFSSKINFCFLFFLGCAHAKSSFGLGLSTGPAYRQDRISWNVGGESEVYPHLRMFDWMLALDAHLGAFHLIGQGDMGWFSSQEMREKASSGLISPISFSFSADGRLASAAVFAGYRVGSERSYWMPMAGWFYDAARVHRSGPTPPFERIEPIASGGFQFADASVAMQSNLRQRWHGALLGAKLAWQPFNELLFEGAYAYGWLHFNQSSKQGNAEQFYLPGPIASSLTQISVSSNASQAGGHGHLGSLKMAIFLSKNIALDLSARFFSLSCAVAKQSSALVGAELYLKF